MNNNNLKEHDDFDGDIRITLNKAQKEILNIGGYPLIHLYDDKLKIKLFSGAKILEDNWKVIADECYNLISSAKIFKDIDTNQYIGNDWKTHMFILMNETIKSNALLAPNTMKLIQKCIDDGHNIRNAFFSILGPNSYITEHSGYMNSVLRYHLGLYVPYPDKSYLIVNKEKINWQEGKGFIWNDNFLHSAHNESNNNRVILILDIVRNDLPVESKKIDDEVMLKFRESDQFKEALKKAVIHK
jgi:aspartyl/asparaginyl beta-hydroxylase (cupin superfamily)